MYSNLCLSFRETVPLNVLKKNQPKRGYSRNKFFFIEQTCYGYKKMKRKDVLTAGAGDMTTTGGVAEPYSTCPNI